MGLGAALNCRCEVVLHQRLTHHRDVVVEVPTDDDGGMRVLSGDVLGDINDSFCFVLQLLLNTSSVMLPIREEWAPSRNYHDMTDSSLTTPLPHLKVYITPYGWISGERFPWVKRIL